MNTVKRQFDLHTRLLNNVLEGIDESETHTRMNDHVNHLKWLAGHLTHTRFSYNKLVQLEPKPFYKELFGPGSQINPDIDYPSIEGIKEDWNAISAKISEALDNLPAEALAGEAPRVPFGKGTLGDYLDFIPHHEAYHIGQMSILRRFLGKEAIKYN